MAKQACFVLLFAFISGCILKFNSVQPPAVVPAFPVFCFDIFGYIIHICIIICPIGLKPFSTDHCSTCQSVYPTVSVCGPVHYIYIYIIFFALRSYSTLFIFSRLQFHTALVTSI